MSFDDEEEMKAFLNKTKIREPIFSTMYLNKGSSLAEGKW